MNTSTARSRESLTTSQLPPIASVAPVSHTIAHQAALQPQPHIQTQQVNAPNAVPASVNVTTSAAPSHVIERLTSHNIQFVSSFSLVHLHFLSLSPLS